MDFGGPDHQVRLVSLHPDVTVAQVLENTAFDIFVPDDVPETTAPTAEDIAIIERFDPTNLRASVVR